MFAAASKSSLLAAKPVVARRQARTQVKAIAQQTKKAEVSQRREIFAGLFAAAAMTVIAQPVQAEERSESLKQKLCAANPTSKACLENSAQN